MNMKRITIITIALAVCICSLFLGGCGKQEGSEFIGTWKYARESGKSFEYIIIKHGNGDSLLVEKYHMWIQEDINKKFCEKREYPATYKNGKLSYKNGEFYLSDKKLKTTDNEIRTLAFEKISEKPMAYSEFNKEGFPDPE